MMQKLENCFCCNSKKFVKLNTRNEYNTRLKEAINLEMEPAWCICCDCGFIFQNPRKEWSALEDFYVNSEYRVLDPETTRGCVNYSTEVLARFDKWLLASDVNLRNFRNVNCLDFGSGYGGSLSFATQQGCKAYGVEIDKQISEIARNSFDIEVVDAVEKLPKDVMFDLIFSNHTLEHVFDPNDFLKFASERITPNGVMIVAFPAWRNSNVISTLNSFDSVEYSKWDYVCLAKILNKHGFYLTSHVFQNYGPGGSWEMAGIAIKSEHKNYFSFSLDEALDELYVNIEKRSIINESNEEKRVEQRTVFHGPPIAGV